MFYSTQDNEVCQGASSTIMEVGTTRELIESEGMDKAKGANLNLARVYQMAGPEFAEEARRALSCGTALAYARKGDGKSLAAANFCRLRLCPVCTRRKARAMARVLSQVLDICQKEHRCQCLFLTLTTRNVEGDKLGAEIKDQLAAFHRLMMQRPIKRAVKGFFRALEVTRNSDRNSEWFGTFHPHIHAILVVEADYFDQHQDKRKNKYLDQPEWVERWKMALGVDYGPVVWISDTYNRKGGRGAVFEAAKYTVKSKDYIDSSLSDEEAVEIVRHYTRGLRRKRLTAFGGWLKEIAARLKCDNPDELDLIDVDGKYIRPDLADLIEYWHWNFGAGDYVLTGVTDVASGDTVYFDAEIEQVRNSEDRAWEVLSGGTK